MRPSHVLNKIPAFLLFCLFFPSSVFPSDSPSPIGQLITGIGSAIYSRGSGIVSTAAGFVNTRTLRTGLVLSVDTPMTMPKRLADGVNFFTGNLGSSLYERYAPECVRRGCDLYWGVKHGTESSLCQSLGSGTYGNIVKPSQEFIADNAIILVMTAGLGTLPGAAGTSLARCSSMVAIKSTVRMSILGAATNSGFSVLTQAISSGRIDPAQTLFSARDGWRWGGGTAMLGTGANVAGFAASKIFVRVGAGLEQSKILLGAEKIVNRVTSSSAYATAGKLLNWYLAPESPDFSLVHASLRSMGSGIIYCSGTNAFSILTGHGPLSPQQDATIFILGTASRMGTHAVPAIQGVTGAKTGNSGALLQIMDHSARNAHLTGMLNVMYANSAGENKDVASGVLTPYAKGALDGALLGAAERTAVVSSRGKLAFLPGTVKATNPGSLVKTLGFASLVRYNVGIAAGQDRREALNDSEDLVVAGFTGRLFEEKSRVLGKEELRKEIQTYLAGRQPGAAFKRELSGKIPLSPEFLSPFVSSADYSRYLSESIQKHSAAPENMFAAQVLKDVFRFSKAYDFFAPHSSLLVGLTKHVVRPIFSVSSEEINHRRQNAPSAARPPVKAAAEILLSGAE